jgi:hypothetical protein
MEFLDEIVIDAAPVPRSILKRRSEKPAKVVPHRGNLLAGIARCAKRRFVDKRVQFRASVDVSEFSRAIGHDAVPQDGTDLAVGLGTLVATTCIPLTRPCRRRSQGECAYLPIETREKVLIESVGWEEDHEDKQKQVLLTEHRQETAQVIQMRRDSNEDAKEPHVLMPTSYQVARERALKVAEETRAVPVDQQCFYWLPFPTVESSSSSSTIFDSPPKAKASKSAPSFFWQGSRKVLPKSILRDATVSYASGAKITVKLKTSTATRKRKYGLRSANLPTDMKAACGESLLLCNSVEITSD